MIPPFALFLHSLARATPSKTNRTKKKIHFSTGAMLMPVPRHFPVVFITLPELGGKGQVPSQGLAPLWHEARGGSSPRP